MKLMRWTIVGATIFGLTACGADEPLPYNPYPDPGTEPGTQTGTTPDPDGPPGTPAVDPLPQTPVCNLNLPVQGRATPGATVFVRTPAGTSEPRDAHPTTGRFCLDAPLAPNQANSIEVFAHGPNGTSPAFTGSVTHSDSCNNGPDPDPTPEATPSQRRNIALASQVRSGSSPDSGSLQYLTDGFPATEVKISGGWAWFGWGGWVMITLDKPQLIEQIVVRWRDTLGGSRSEYGAEYRVLTNAMSEATDPNVDQKDGWTTIHKVSGGDGGDDPIDLSQTKPFAQHIAFWLDKDGASWTWSESFAFKEIEIYVSEDSTTPSYKPGEMTCQSIGSGS